MALQWRAAAGLMREEKGVTPIYRRQATCGARRLSLELRGRTWGLVAAGDSRAGGAAGTPSCGRTGFPRQRLGHRVPGGHVTSGVATSVGGGRRGHGATPGVEDVGVGRTASHATSRSSADRCLDVGQRMFDCAILQ